MNVEDLTVSDCGVRESSPMIGWEVSGCTPPGAGAADEHILVFQCAGTEEWPAAEVHEGVAGFQIGGHADSVDDGGTFTRVWGPDLEACKRLWLRLAERIGPDLDPWGQS